MLRLVAQAYALLVLLGALPLIAWAFSRSMLLGVALLVTAGSQWLAVVGLGLLRWVNPPTTSFMLQTAHTLRQAGSPQRVERQWVPIRALSPELLLAAIASEDVYFAHHSGFDWLSLRLALAANEANGNRKRGGSTITQQLAKNLFLWEERSYVRKGLEAYITLLIEAAWPKYRILEVYLNVVQFGPFTFGAEAAAQRFFNKSAQALTRSESALLVTALPNPMANHIEEPARLMRYRQLLIVGNMQRLGPGYLARLSGRPA